MHRRMTCGILFVSLSFAASCGSRNEPKQKIPFPQIVTFSTIRSAILEPKCSRCHLTLTSYEGAQEYFVAGSPQQSNLYTAVEENSMPPNGTPLNAEEKAAIYRWINQGAKNDN